MAWELLFSSDFGLMTVAGITFMILMGVFMTRMYKKKMDEEIRKLGK
ncbi:MAG: DUF3149 domain-containing protein [Candidatus Dechloromonas phosphoritropha]|jgi:hypothetical protein|nr:DUF3149 domain-containing protein [Azonexus sp.]MBP9229254.1 DUF3149 domain-containing protein [Azonexus sp.]